MSPHRCRAVLTQGVEAHPAVRAWAAATSLDSTPECVHVFRERSAGAVYRLPGVGVGGTAVFAKRSPSSWIAIEQTVYEQILPQLPLTAPRYYGTSIEGRYGWIFVEDVGQERFSREDPVHFEVAARWVGTLHTTAIRVAAARSLPDAGAPRYLQHLRRGCDTIQRGLRTWPFRSDEVDVLHSVLSQCSAIEARWDRVAASCDGVPPTLVHGDFQPKNAFLRKEGTNLSLWPIDWEMAGFGTPAADLMRIDLHTYWQVVRPAWPDVSLQTVERLARAGRVFGWLAAVDWETASLMCEDRRDRKDAVVQLTVVSSRLNEAARAAGLLE